MKKSKRNKIKLKNIKVKKNSGYPSSQVKFHLLSKAPLEVTAPSFEVL